MILLFNLEFFGWVFFLPQITQITQITQIKQITQIIQIKQITQIIQITQITQIIQIITHSLRVSLQVFRNFLPQITQIFTNCILLKYDVFLVLY